jgi:hypothetical protein
VGLPTEVSQFDYRQFFNEDFYRQLAVGLILVVIVPMAALLTAIIKILTPHAISFLRTILLFIAVALFFFLGLAALRLSSQATSSNPISIEAPKFLWLPLTNSQTKKISLAFADAGPHRTEIWRSDSSDCSTLADELAGVVQENRWDLPSPPYLPTGYFGTGMTLFARPTDNKIEALRKVMSEQLGIEVDREPLNEEIKALDGAPVDLRIFIGARERPSLFIEGTQKVPPGATEVTIKVPAKVPYGVSGNTSWGAFVSKKEALDGQFTVQFSTGAPASSPPQTLNWTVFRYF